MVLRVTYVPDSGTLEAEAKLTPASYVLSGDAKLTGGFAYYMWFRNGPDTGPDAYKAGDFVVTRIMWLDGQEQKNANTKERYIYIHGTNHEECLGRPASIGCIRMSNPDVAELFDKVEEGTRVWISE